MFWRLGSIAVLAAGACVAGELRLIDAIKNDDRKSALALIRSRAEIDAAQPDGSTPLAWAAYKDDTELALLLLKAGAKATTADDYGETPLTLTCANGNALVAR